MDYIRDTSLVLDLPLYKLDGGKFMSRDAYGHLCTVTEAVWTPQGRTLDGVNDVIDCGSGATLYPAQFTLMVWLKMLAVAGAGEYPREVGCFSDAGGADYRGFGLFTPQNVSTVWGEVGLTTAGLTQIQLGSPAIGDWHQYTLTYDELVLRRYYDSVKGDDAAFVDTVKYPSATNFRLGENFSGHYINSEIGEVLLYNRNFNPLEVQHNYQATKWRYK